MNGWNSSYNQPLYCIVLYCVVSYCIYLYVCIALLTVHNNQKRFQCKIPREMKVVLRERKEAPGSPVNKEERCQRRETASVPTLQHFRVNYVHYIHTI